MIDPTILAAMISNSVVVVLAITHVYNKWIKRLSWMELSIVYILKSYSDVGDDVATEMLDMMHTSFNPKYKTCSLIQKYLMDERDKERNDSNNSS